MDTISERDADSIPDRGPTLIVMMWTLTSLSFVTVVLRFIFRARKRQVGWDDIFMGTTWVRKTARKTEVILTASRCVSLDGLLC